MAYTLDDKLVIAITSRALFALDDAHCIYEERGLDEYRQYQREHEQVPLEPGTGYPLVQSLLAINHRAKAPLIEVVLLTKNDADSGLRVVNSIEHHKMAISRMGFTGGQPPYVYLEPFSCDLYLSADEAEVREALDRGFAAALVYPPPKAATATEKDEVRIAFDLDAVLFSPESEEVYQREGLEGFHRHEVENETKPVNPGPFKKFLDSVSAIQRRFPDDQLIRTAVFSSRGGPAHKRAILTLRQWGLRVDESFFLGGVEKAPFLEVFSPHIFFDDQKTHLEPASLHTPCAWVPWDAASLVSKA